MENYEKTCSGNHILVGLGGTGGKILRAFKMRMFEEFPTAEERAKQAVSLLYVDSTDEMMSQDGKARADFRVMGQDASFTNNEFLNIKAIDVKDILDHIDNYPTIKGIVKNVNAVRTAIGSLGQAAGQKRRAGRLLFAVNAGGYVHALKNAYARCNEVSGSSEHLNIYIFAGLCGGTGSGSVVDATLQARKAYPNAKITVFAMIPEMHLPKAEIDQGRYYPNGYAAMNELNAMQCGRWFPQDVLNTGECNAYTDIIKGVADGLVVYSNENENGLTLNSLKELPKTVSDFVFARIYYFNGEGEVYDDIKRAFNFENMDGFQIENDETAYVEYGDQIPAARTKKVNSFGIKRVMYPELRVLKHITYTVGESVLYQFKYNNWRDNQGYVNEERNKDYRKAYLNKDQLAEWMLDEDHMTLNLKILESDTDYPKFADYWHDKVLAYVEDAKKADCPLNELDNIMGSFFTTYFREDGVESFFNAKEKAIPEMAKEIRHKVESDLFSKWKLGDVSIVELQKVSKLLLERITDMRTELEARTKEERDNFEACNEDRELNVREWSRLGILQRMVGIGARRYADHQTLLEEFYTLKTQLVALEFAKKLCGRLLAEISKMDTEIADFSKKISDAIEETERLVTAQRKVNKGLEDMRGAIIEVCEEEAMMEFEVEMKVDKTDMPNIARQIRDAILPQSDFTTFGDLTNYITVDDIKDAFDIKLAQIIRTKHSEKPSTDNKVLGLNILTQLQQKLTSDDAIKKFATDVIKQSGVYLKLNKNQIQMNLNNNEVPFEHRDASINKKVIIVNIPSPDTNEGLKKFADKLKDALAASFRQGDGRVDITFNTKSKRVDELSIVTLLYCFPMRCIDWMSTYRQRYERFLTTGNPNTDLANAILLHSEGDGKQLPSLFAVENWQEIYEKNKREKQMAAQPAAQPAVQPQTPPMGGATPPPPPGTSVGSCPPPPPVPEPEISVMLYVGGQQYGPYNREMCKQMLTAGQLTKDTLVWMEGMPAWTPAGQVQALQSLFAPQMPPSMPPVPPMPPVM